MHRGFLKTGFFLGALSVALGAFGAHALKSLAPAGVLNTFETAVRYQFYHLFALLLAAVLYRDLNKKWVSAAGWLFIGGMILFSGSLYLLCLVQTAGIPGYKWLGAITPFGYCVPTSLAINHPIRT
jgi:uncharacterized membrane protein YgdD (TMEM256/DUF423 family)